MHFCYLYNSNLNTMKSNFHKRSFKLKNYLFLVFVKRRPSYSDLRTCPSLIYSYRFTFPFLLLLTSISPSFSSAPTFFLLCSFFYSYLLVAFLFLLTPTFLLILLFLPLLPSYFPFSSFYSYLLIVLFLLLLFLSALTLSFTFPSLPSTPNFYFPSFSFTTTFFIVFAFFYSYLFS